LELQIKFVNSAQRAFYFSTVRNQCFSGGFNNGKSFGGCCKAFTLLSTFSNYRMVIARQTYSDLKKTTMQTFFKICPPGIIARHNEQDGYTEFINKSVIHWLHLDKVDESTLRGLEINSALIDQAEEIEEKVFDVLDGRIGRWDNAVVPEALLRQYPNWPKNKLTDKFIAPSYHMLLCNPDTQFHFIFRKFHPDSLERRPAFFFVEGEWDKNLGSSETYSEALTHDPEWVNKYVKGQWGISSAQIHKVESASQLDFTPELLDKIKRKGNLFRVLDHGDASPTCCLWVAVIGGVYIFYREYYTPNRPISYHRKAIDELSEGEKYSANYADPQIFKTTSQRDGGFWSTADEYMDPSLDAPALHWVAADNNEFATRNRVNEKLQESPLYKHPITELAPAPGIYFIKKSKAYPNGCFHAISEVQSQRRKSLGYIDGKQIFCDDREDSVTDHAYDCVRYFVAMHSSGRGEPGRKAPRMSMKYYQMAMKRQKANSQKLQPMSA
jgi:hypothetical protein